MILSVYVYCRCTLNPSDVIWMPRSRECGNTVKMQTWEIKLELLYTAANRLSPRAWPPCLWALCPEMIVRERSPRTRKLKAFRGWHGWMAGCRIATWRGNWMRWNGTASRLGKGLAYNMVSRCWVWYDHADVKRKDIGSHRMIKLALAILTMKQCILWMSYSTHDIRASAEPVHLWFYLRWRYKKPSQTFYYVYHCCPQFPQF